MTPTQLSCAPVLPSPQRIESEEGMGEAICAEPGDRGIQKDTHSHRGMGNPGRKTKEKYP